MSHDDEPQGRPRFTRRKLLVASVGVATLAIGCDDETLLGPPGNLMAPDPTPPPEPLEPPGPQVPEEEPEEEDPPPPGNLMPPTPPGTPDP